MDNQRYKSFILVLLIVILLLLAFFIPKIKIGSMELKRVNILGDVMAKDSTGQILAEVKMDSLIGTLDLSDDSLDISPPQLGEAFDVIDDDTTDETGNDSVNGISEEEVNPNEPTKFTDAELDTTYTPVNVEAIDYSNVDTNGMTAIEDFGGSMNHFYSALSQAGSRPVRIAFFGDSFIEGDILSGDLREMLQARYGGKGVGWVDISCVSEGFRSTARTKSNGWSKHHANDRSGYQNSFQGLNGGYFIPSGTGSFSVTTSKGHAATADRAFIFLSPDGITLEGSVNGGGMEILGIGGNSTLGIAEIEGSSIGKLTLNASGSGRVLGVALDGNTGIVVDNYSMRGSNGCYIANTSDAMLSSYAQYRPYDLFIFEYGLNIANKKVTNYSSYTSKFKRVIHKIKSHFPNASILIMGSGDRGMKSGGDIITMPGVKELIVFQRQMAMDEGVAFWNTFAAMGGEGGIARMLQKKQASLDYTHINKAGGKVIAKSLFDALTSGH